MTVYHISTNPDTDHAGGRNGFSKMKFLSIFKSNGHIFIDGVNSRDITVSGGGFRFDAAPESLRELSRIFAAFAQETEAAGNSTPIKTHHTNLDS